MYFARAKIGLIENKINLKKALKMFFVECIFGTAFVFDTSSAFEVFIVPLAE